MVLRNWRLLLVFLVAACSVQRQGARPDLPGHDGGLDASRADSGSGGRDASGGASDGGMKRDGTTGRDAAAMDASADGDAATPNDGSLPDSGASDASAEDAAAMDDGGVDCSGQPAGTACGVDRVCDGDGDCIECAEGDSCDTENPCTEGTVQCGSGTPECVESAVENGTDCGSACTDECNGVRRVCMGGSCEETELECECEDYCCDGDVCSELCTGDGTKSCDAVVVDDCVAGCGDVGSGPVCL